VSRLLGLFDRIGWMWGRVEAGWRAVMRRLRRRQRQIQAEVRHLGEELREFVDDLAWIWTPPSIVPVRKRFYGHGAYMGAAPILVADPVWRRILGFLMPDVYAQVRTVLARDAAPRPLIPMFENNPVMAAFGILHGSKAGEEVGGMEWDVFVDGALVGRWERSAPGPARDRMLADVVDTMVIAHASTTDTLQEALGMDQYLDVRKTEKTAFGGVETNAWMDLFGRALELATAPDLETAIRAMASDGRVETDEECRRWTFAKPRAVADVVGVWRQVTGRDLFSVIIEIKSMRSTPALLVGLVAELNRRGIHVAGVGSFALAEVAGVGAVEQSIGGVAHPGPREILFMHFAGDLQEACDAGLVPQGQTVMFNGASLLDADESEPSAYRVKEDVIAELIEYQTRFDLAIGVYVQEPDCDDRAVSLLSELVSRDGRTFALGFAWGGLHDAGALPSDGADRRGYGSQRHLETVGRAQQWRPGLHKPPEA